MSIAVMTSSTAFTKFFVSKVPSFFRNFSRFSDARLQELLSRLMYSEHGLDALIRPVSGLVCQSLIVSSYWMPGSAHSQAAWVTLLKRVFASTVSMTEPSAPRMKLTGPEAVPPEESSSLEERMRDRFRPAPEPPLKMSPSSRYQLRIESISSSTARMKQALTCCGALVPTLNQTGLLKLKYWCMSIQVSSCSKTSASPSEAK